MSLELDKATSLLLLKRAKALFYRSRFIKQSLNDGTNGYCALGAIVNISYKMGIYQSPELLIPELITALPKKYIGIARFNDDPKTKKKEVYDFFMKAIELVKLRNE